MKCPACGNPDSHVLDSRPIEDGASIKRRRECGACGKRFTTYEVIDSVPLMVVKKDSTREIFDKHKLLSGILKVCQKRPVDAVTLVREIEAELQNSLRQEVTSMEIGEMVMRKLKERDEVAYVRFASVYREFKDIDTFMKELKVLQEGIEKDKK